LAIHATRASDGSTLRRSKLRADRRARRSGLGRRRLWARTTSRWADPSGRGRGSRSRFTPSHSGASPRWPPRSRVERCARPWAG